MSITNLWAEGWRGLSGLCTGNRSTVSEMLSRHYVEESRHLLMLEQHAAQMPYARFRETLLRIAGDEEKHVQWLREKLVALGGELPEVPAIESQGKNSWECLLADLEEERRCAAALTEKILAIKSREPEIAAGLQSILEDAGRHREEIREMLMRSDPYADQAA